jgi:hypothetical protein
MINNLFTIVKRKMDRGLDEELTVVLSGASKTGVRYSSHLLVLYYDCRIDSFLIYACGEVLGKDEEVSEGKKREK